MRRFQRLKWAALASLVIHVTLLVLLWDVEPPAIPKPPPSTQVPLSVEIITRSKAEPSKPPPPTRREQFAKPPPLREPRVRREPPIPPAPPRDDREPPSPVPPPSEDDRGPLSAAPPPSEAGREVPPEESLPSEAEREVPPEEPLPSEPDAPSAGVTLAPMPPPDQEAPSPSLAAPAAPRGFYPLPPSLMPGGPPITGPKSQSGHTLRPGDPSLSPDVLAARETARVSGRVQAFIDDNQAELRVANGQIDPYFSRLREALEKSFEDAPVFEGTSLLDHATHSWAAQAGKFGATGNPGTGPVAAAPTASEQLKALQERLGDESLEYLRGLVQAGEEVQKLGGGGGEKLVVTLELHQGPDGTLRDAKLVSTSGNKAYDAYVLSGVPPALAKLPPPPDEARGVRPDGIHTLWSVEGRVVYLRKLKELKGQDTAYMAAALAAGMLAGRFEETTGEFEVIDFRNPRFVCQARLLRVY